MLKIIPLTLGPVETNAYLVADSNRGEAVVIDPAWDGELILKESKNQGWTINQIWLTHAHFDHIAGARAIVDQKKPSPPIALHAADLPLYNMQGGAPLFGMKINPAPKPEINLQTQNSLQVGGYQFKVIHTPGHTPGHVVFYCPAEKTIFCGDLIFKGSVGRTDLPGGSYQALIHSIQTCILVLPDDVRLFSGHGPETTIGIERAYNPYFA